MYLSFFNLNQAPFSITPNPEFVYLSEKHQECLAHLVYGVTRGGGSGFVQLTGEVGTGKTTICRLFLKKLPENTQAALILNPNLTPLELLEVIFDELKIDKQDCDGQLNKMIDRLNQKLMTNWAAGKNTVVVIDEAQNIPRDTLEQLRLLTNLETEQQKLLQIVLIGQPELKQLTQRKDLRQLAQRITSRFHLLPLSAKETAAYIKHRLQVSGANRKIFTQGSIRRIHKLTQGTPRLINILCDRSLLAAFVAESPTVKKKHVLLAAKETLDHEPQKKYWLYLFAPPLLFSLVAYFSVFIDQTVTENQSEPAFQTLLENTENNNSWNAYLQRWNQQATTTWAATRCPSVAEIGMACLRRKGNLTQIKQLNTPVLLEVEQRLLLLNAINPQSLLISTAKDDFQLPIKRFEKQWLGTYFVIWPLATELVGGSPEKQINNWALQMIQAIDNDTEIKPSELKEHITAFQQAHGLLPDGIVGIETQMALSLKAYRGPKLE